MSNPERRLKANLPNSRERIAARRRLRGTSGTGSLVRPKPSRSLREFLLSGRIAALLMLGASLGSLLWLFLSDAYLIGSVEVRGSEWIDRETVVSRSGLVGNPIWYIDEAAVVAQLLTNPYLASADVELHLPNRATIHVTERVPEVRWVIAGIPYLVDLEGRILGPATGVTSPTGEILEVQASGALLGPGDQVDRDALLVARLLNRQIPLELGFTPSEIGWDFGLGVFVRTSEGQQIVFGRSEQLERKLAVWRYLREQGTPFTYLDLRPENPFFQNKP